MISNSRRWWSSAQINWEQLITTPPTMMIYNILDKAFINVCFIQTVHEYNCSNPDVCLQVNRIKWPPSYLLHHTHVFMRWLLNTTVALKLYNEESERSMFARLPLTVLLLVKVGSADEFFLLHFSFEMNTHILNSVLIIKTWTWFA